MKNQKKLPYIVVAVAACMMACGIMGLPNAYGVFYTPMAEALGVGKGSVTLHISLSSLFGGFCAPLVAAMIRKKIPLRYIILAGSLLVLVAGLGIAYAPSVMFMNIMAPIRGLGSALVSSMVITMIIGNWFVKYRGTLTGVALSFSGVGSAISAPILNACMQNFGLKPTYIGFIIAMVLLISPAAFLCPLTPQEVGLRPFGEGESVVKNEKKKASLANLDLPFRYGSSVFISLIVLIAVMVTLTSINSHLPSAALTFGYTAAVGATVLSISMIGNVVSKFVLGVITDFVGIYKGVALVLAETALGLLLINFSNGNVILLYLGGFLFGSCFSLGSLAASMITRHIYGDAQYGKVYAYITMAVYVASAVTVTLIGYMYDLTGSYHATMIVWSILAAAAMLILLFTAVKAEKEAKTH